MSTLCRFILFLVVISTFITGCTPTTTQPVLPSTDTPVPPVTAAPTNTPEIPNIIWNRLYGGEQNDVAWDVQLTEDGGFYVLGTTGLEFGPDMLGDIYLIRMDPDGNVLWEKTYGGAKYEEGLHISRTIDGGLLLSGMTASFGAGGMDAYLVKIDTEGNELWSRTLGGPLDEMAAAEQQPDGSFIFCGNLVDPNDIVVADAGAAGYGGFSGRSTVYLAKTDPEGNELWTRTFGADNNLITAGCVQASDGGFLALATLMRFPAPDDDICLVKVDQDGNEVWSRTWEEGTMTAYDLIPTSDGNFLIAGSLAPADDVDRLKADFFFIKVDQQGNEIWMNTFGDPGMIDYPELVTETGDGGYLVIGQWERDLSSGLSDIILVKIDGNGQPVWQDIIRVGAHSMFGDLLQLPDGKYIFLGSRLISSQFDIFSIKVDIGNNVP
jgi:hypothetical protein